MKLFSSLKQKAKDFIEPYKSQNPATYAAAEQAIGAVLIADGFLGIDNPFGDKKRPGIFGTIIGMIFGVVFMFTPAFIGNITNIDKMTSQVQATVTEVNSGTDGVCSLKASYLVDGEQYTNQSSFSSSDYCSLSIGQSIVVNYDSTNPGSWGYGVNKIGGFMKIFFWAGLLVLISSIITFFIRLFSIIFGWKLLRDGRRNAAMLPPGTDLGTIIMEIKKNFTESIFGFGGKK